MILKCQKLPLGTAELMYLLCDIDVKMNICKRCSAVRSWRRCSNLDASDRSTQIPQSPPWVKSLGVKVIEAKQKASIPVTWGN